VRRTLVGLMMVGALALTACGVTCGCSENGPRHVVPTTTTTCTLAPNAVGGGCGVYKPVPSTTTTVIIP
jgi:hypothetical protein